LLRVNRFSSRPGAAIPVLVVTMRSATATGLTDSGCWSRCHSNLVRPPSGRARTAFARGSVGFSLGSAKDNAAAIPPLRGVSQ